MEEIKVTKSSVILNRRRRIGIGVELNAYIGEIADAIVTVTEGMQIDPVVNKTENNCTHIVIYYTTETMNSVQIKEIQECINFTNNILSIAVDMVYICRKIEALKKDINGNYYAKFTKKDEDENKTEGVQ